MKRKSNEDIGLFNVMLIGENPHAISIADNIHSAFNDATPNKVVNASLNFNIVVDEADENAKSHSWFNEFIFSITEASRFNNIVVSEKFKEWEESCKPDMERIYMKKLLQAMNFVIVDISIPEKDKPTDKFGGGGGYETIFDNDIPQCRFNENCDFLGDTEKWIDKQFSKLDPKISLIRLIRSLCGKGNLTYLGDVFGCLSGKKYESIIKTDKLRFDAPILFDEFCAISKGRDIKEIEGAVFTRTNSTLSSFFK